MALVKEAPGTTLGAMQHLEEHANLSEVRYAHPEGNNANDGLTWGTAKKDVLAAYDALPTSGGVIHIGSGVFWDSVNTDRGFWIVGGNDPSFASPPTGWRQQKRVHIMGTGATHVSFARAPQAEILGGSSTDRLKPSIWLSGTAVPITFENVFTHYQAVNVRLGISTDMSTYTNTAGIEFRNFGAELHQITGNGPSYEIGYAYWIYWKDCQLFGNASVYPITAASIQSGTTARFTVGTHSFKVGDTVDVTGVTPAGYNGYWTITAVAATTFDANIGTSPSAGSAFGQAEPILHYKRAAVGHDTIDYFPTFIGAGLWEFRNCVFGGGGIHFASNGTTSAGGVVMKDIVHEGDFVGPEPPSLHVRGPSRGQIPSSVSGFLVENVQHADASSPTGVVLVDGTTTSPNTVISINTPTQGAGVTRLTGDITGRQQVGISQGNYYGPSEAAHYGFGPTPILGTNLVNTDATTWTAGFGAATVTSGKKAPDGTTNAAAISGANNPFNNAQIYRTGASPAVGDWLIGGVWRRFVSGTFDPSNGFTWAGMSLLNCTFDDHPSQDISIRSGASQIDGAWDWTWRAAKVISYTGAGSEIIFSLNSPQNGEVEYAYPVFMHIPAANALDDDQMRNLGRYLRGFPSGTAATAGNIGIFKDQKLVFAPDVNLYRSAANTLATDDSFVAPQDFSTIKVGNSSASDVSFGIQVNGVHWVERLQSSDGQLQLAHENGVANFLGVEKTTGKLNVNGSQIAMSAAGAFIEQVEGSDPSAPASNKSRLFTRDNGSGKTQLCVRFATGAVQVIATEP